MSWQYVMVANTPPRNQHRLRGGKQLRRAPDQIKQNWLLRDDTPDWMEMGVLHHPVPLNQCIHHIAATQAPVTTQPHGMITFLEIDQIVRHH